MMIYVKHYPTDTPDHQKNNIDNSSMSHRKFWPHNPSVGHLNEPVANSLINYFNQWLTSGLRPGDLEL